ncbi:protein phosphatase 3 regulatory subunit [Klebsormidium nitens]|uniref:Protein phosphatase 3 regulatory subunit n=1 Tax=Klebsormidium nitens TaxID=105231 RepID=A0A0U9HR34_KLENI|nr:protein phosphatase 3 regulatory subunit [Klebsormidium nitens]|eukprot:GAQ80563.1 protein phosphatase 3 regulatory subunit [Klebsormidium nitens]
MGAQQSLSKEDVQHFVDTTYFNAGQVRTLHKIFCEVAAHKEVEKEENELGDGKDGGGAVKALIGTLSAPLEHAKKHGGKDEASIQKKELQLALGLKQPLLVERMFSLLDQDRNGKISFAEFCNTLSAFAEEAPDLEKTKLSFRLFANQQGEITHRELAEMLAAVSDEGTLDFSTEEAAAVVERTFEEADLNKDDKIDFSEYCRLLKAYPAVLKNLSINLQLLPEEPLIGDEGART